MTGRPVNIFWFRTYLDDPQAFFSTKTVGRGGTYRIMTAIAVHHAALTPGLQSAKSDTRHFTGPVLSCTTMYRSFNQGDCFKPLRVRGQSSSSSSKRADSFSCKTSSAATSASAFSLRRSSFSSWWIRVFLHGGLSGPLPTDDAEAYLPPGSFVSTV